MLVDDFRAAAPALSAEVDRLVGTWTRGLRDRLGTSGAPQFSEKQVNDPIWGTIELYKWEVALLDTGLWQRMRGIRQLGLAPLVFPSATHDRLEHILGVVGATDAVLDALNRQIVRYNAKNTANPLPQVTEEDRHALRLAALFHDIGHGPFSHASEPVLQRQSLLGEATAGTEWRAEFDALGVHLQQCYSFDHPPPISELISALIVASEPITAILSNRAFPYPGDTTGLQERMIAAITGAVHGPGADHLSQVISGQIDADKMDYLQRDAHHAGLQIGFDTSRLISRLEVLQIRPNNITAELGELREKVSTAEREGGRVLRLGIAASGFGSFEQMLIGRTFLYDRLYHHHKVRAAEAMAQRLMLVAERDRGAPFGFEDLFLNVGDDTYLRIFAGEVTHPGIGAVPPAATKLAKALLERNLLHRAYALRGRLIAVGEGGNQQKADQKRQKLWSRVLPALDTLKDRYDFGAEIHQLATRAAAAIAEVDTSEQTAAIKAALAAVGPEQIIVDLPSLKANAIRLLARYPNGAIRIPEFSFNPYKWSDAYELQKRTAYVFCPREVVPIIELAAKIVFFSRFGIIMGEEADGFIKASKTLPPAWIDALVGANIIDEKAREFLVEKRRSLLRVDSRDLKVPQGYLDLDEDFAHRLANALNDQLEGGLAADQLAALGKVLEAIWHLIDHWHLGGSVTKPLEDEAALQEAVASHLRMRGIAVSEAPKASGGITDLYLENAIVLECKFEGETEGPEVAKDSAGSQGRRYAIALDSQLVLVVIAYQPKPGEMRDKSQSVLVKPIRNSASRKAEIRIMLPYGAPVPSREKG